MTDALYLKDISSRENPLVKRYAKLRDYKKYRSELGMFVIEGARLCADAAAEGMELEYGFITHRAAEKYPDTADALHKALGDRLYFIPEELAQVLSDTKGSQGIYCCVKIRTLDKIISADKINDGGKYLVLNNLQDPGNIGTIIRAADAVGIDRVYLCSCCDIYNPKTVRSAMGSMFRVKLTDNDNYADVISSLKDAGVTTYASVIDSSAQSLRDTVFDRRSAVVIGNEGNGLSEEDADACDKKITIKMKGNINSLNAASAASIMLWEMTRTEE